LVAYVLVNQIDSFFLFGAEGATKFLDSNTVNETTGTYALNDRSPVHLQSSRHFALFP
jgi:hypothetical protein